MEPAEQAFPDKGKMEETLWPLPIQPEAEAGPVLLGRRLYLLPKRGTGELVFQAASVFQINIMPAEAEAETERAEAPGPAEMTEAEPAEMGPPLPQPGQTAWAEAEAEAAEAVRTAETAERESL